MTAPAAKGMSVSASVTLRNQPEKRVRKAARPRGRAGRITGDKPGPWACPSHSNINEKNNIPIRAGHRLVSSLGAGLILSKYFRVMPF